MTHYFQIMYFYQVSGTNKSSSSGLYPSLRAWLNLHGNRFTVYTTLQTTIGILICPIMCMMAKIASFPLDATGANLFITPRCRRIKSVLK